MLLRGQSAANRSTADEREPCFVSGRDSALGEAPGRSFTANFGHRRSRGPFISADTTCVRQFQLRFVTAARCPLTHPGFGANVMHEPSLMIERWAADHLQLNFPELCSMRRKDPGR